MESFKGHSFATVAVTVPEHWPELKEALHQGDWGKVVGRDEFDQRLDSLSVRVVSCSSGRMMWAVVVNPVVLAIPYVVGRVAHPFSAFALCINNEVGAPSFRVRCERVGTGNACA